MIELQNVKKYYASIAAVDGVSFCIPRGHVCGYLGPNGAGKSTTVKMIVGLLEPSEGRVLWNGNDIRSDLLSYRARVGYVPEEPIVYSHLSGMEYLALVGRLRQLPEKLINRRATELFRLLDLDAFRDVTISSYSKGMKQRLLIIAALLHDPDLLVLDEPLSGLDVTAARVIKDLLIELANSGKAILYISHVLEVVEKVCDRILIIDRGRIQADASAQELTALMKLPSLEHVFSRVVQQQGTHSTAKRIVAVLREDA